MKSYKYIVYLSIDYDAWFVALETDSFIQLVKFIIINFKHQIKIILRVK